MHLQDDIEQLFVLKAKEMAKGNEIEEKAMYRVFKVSFPPIHQSANSE